MTSVSPLLRSPPFPWVKPATAAVSAPGHTDVSDDDIARLSAAILSARVGGTFWQPAPRVPSEPFALIAATSAEQIKSMERRAVRARLAVVALTDAVDPWPLIERAERIYASVDHELAALATIAGRTPRLFGVRSTPPLVRNFLAAARYRDPFTGAPATIEHVVAILAQWRALIDANRPVAALVGISGWKRAAIAPLFWSTDPPRFARSTTAALRRAGRERIIAAWPSREPADLRARAVEAGVPVASVEDGFIRSVGLGSGLHPPFSIAVDRQGIHYDPNGPSDLETLIETAAFTPDLLARAAALRASILVNRVGKYGAGGAAPLPPRTPGKRLVLVAGQVEDDLSVRRGGGGIAGNLHLLARARALEPDAEIWYRPHPDVDAGHRRGALADTEVLRHADAVMRGQAMADLLAHVDGVHVLTSLTGFEALLRGRDVTTHGVPFFAGWGLTRDQGAVPARRTRRLSLDALVAGALILYPRYLDPVTRLPCTVELLIERFQTHPTPPATLVTTLRAWQGRARRALGR